MGNPDRVLFYNYIDLKRFGQGESLVHFKRAEEPRLTSRLNCFREAHKSPRFSDLLFHVYLYQEVGKPSGKAKVANISRLVKSVFFERFDQPFEKYYEHRISSLNR